MKNGKKVLKECCGQKEENMKSIVWFKCENKKRENWKRKEDEEKIKSQKLRMKKIEYLLRGFSGGKSEGWRKQTLFYKQEKNEREKLTGKIIKRITSKCGGNNCKKEKNFYK